MSPHANRLIHEASPYLLQHAHNPVDWYPWGPEALLRSKREDKPILLSIGYSACHWCHVMERESFEDEAIAKQMNDSFVCIKVDREERPDLDHLYQLVVQLIGRSGGWPLTVFLTPEQRPFFGGTYFPPRDRHGLPGLPRVLAAVVEAYRERRADIATQALELSHAIARASEVETRGAPDYSPAPDLLARASQKLMARFDGRNGGFGTAPKFPSSMPLDVLLRRAVLEKDEAAAACVKRALVAMREGGLFDQLAGGFHRYSTDAEWLVPHFEKMLYDNALLLRSYVDAYRAFGDEAFAATASDIGTWLLAEMQAPEGGFYATLDADSEGEEGKYYVFSAKEVEEALAGDALAIAVARRHFGVADEGNFEGTESSVLHVAEPLDEVASALGESLEATRDALRRAVAGLSKARSARVRPHRDEKVLAGWNGLVIGALADASIALGEPSLLSAAERAFAHIERALVRGGQVDRLTKDGVGKGPGFLDDHAFVARAAIDLYEATGEPRYLERARAIADEILARFWDAESGGFFFSPSDGEALLCRVKDPFDQATPSGGSIASLVLLVLGGLVSEAYAERAEAQLERLAPAAVDNPFAFAQTVCVLDRLVRGSTDVVIIGARDDSRTLALVNAAFAAYLPNRSIVRIDPADAASSALPKLAAEGKPSHDVPVAYVCRQRTCSAPVETAEALAAALRS